MEIRRARLIDPEVRPLLDGLATEYAQRYGWAVSAEEMAGGRTSDFEAPGGTFVILVDEGTTVAGGGFRRHAAGVCEVKRMWTDPARRRQGLARLILTVLEDEARAIGYDRVRIVTGPAQPEAIALYLSCGYEPVPFDSEWCGLAFERDLEELQRAAVGSI